MIYLDNAATSFPKPDAVYDRVTTMLHECGIRQKLAQARDDLGTGGLRLPRRRG